MTGEFAYGSDLVMDDMIWGATLRSPHPHARIKSVEIGEALATAGVYAVLTCDDVPGENAYGLEHADQPVLAADLVRYAGEPVALVAADHPEVARRAASKIVVDYEVLPPVTDAEAALDPAAPRSIQAATWSATSRSARATPNPQADVVVKAATRSACRTRLSWAPRPAWRSPTAKAVSTCSSPPSGCTSTSARSARPSACRRKRSG